MPTRKQKETEHLKERVRQIWDGTPAEDRSARVVAKRVKAMLNVEVSSTTIHRWSHEWAGTNPVREVVRYYLPAPEPEELPPPNFLDIPEELRNVLDPRLSALARIHGCERIERAIIVASDAIAENMPEIIRLMLDTETERTEESGPDGAKKSMTTQKAQAGRAAIGAIVQMASAMQIITQTRATASLAHRNFNEGDLLGAQAGKFRAETDKITNELRGDSAKDITPRAERAEDGEEALNVLRGMATKT